MQVLIDLISSGTIMAIECIQIDYNNPAHAEDLISLLNEYALDPMGGGEPLSDNTKQTLASELSQRSNAFSIIAYVDNRPAGLANCFEEFSTFKCLPLVNIHDLVVSKNFRGQGLAKHLLDAVEKIARDNQCCKLTLEVLEGNKKAQEVYLKFGFDGYQLDPKLGNALFWEKSLS